MKAAIASTGFALLVTGCAVLGPFETEEPAPSVQAAPPPAINAEGLLHYFQQIRNLPAGELGREHELVRRAYDEGRSDFNRIRLAMVLSLPTSAVNDEARALELLEPVMRNSKSSLHGLALLMGTYLQEQRRLGSSVQGMRQKLEDLKSLERSLIERELGGAARR
jgi:hypothetical protein